MTENQSITSIPEEQEEWRPVAGFEGIYEISNIGRVRSYARPYMGWQLLKPHCSSNKVRYFHVDLCIAGSKKSRNVHALVAQSFIGAKPRGYQVNHKDTNTFNNRVDNLEYVTPSQNTLHASRMGLMKACRPLVYAHGENHGMSKLTDEIVIEMRQLHAAGMSFREIARRSQVCARTAARAIKGLGWAHVPRLIADAATKVSNAK